MITTSPDLEPGHLAALLVGIVAPRPDAWLSTLSAEGVHNLAPFSLFNPFSVDPPVVALGLGNRNGNDKDSLRNVRDLGEFVVNVVSEPLAKLAIPSGAPLESDHDEWQITDVPPMPARRVRPPRVAWASAALECRVRRIVDLGSQDRPSRSIVIGDVVCLHVVRDALDDLVPRPDALQHVGITGDDYWVRTGNTVRLAKAKGWHPREIAERARATHERLGAAPRFVERRSLTVDLVSQEAPVTAR